VAAPLRGTRIARHEPIEDPMAQRRLQLALAAQPREAAPSRNMPSQAQPVTPAAPSAPSPVTQRAGAFSGEDQSPAALGRGSLPPEPRPRELVEISAPKQEARPVRTQEVFATIASGQVSASVSSGAGLARMRGSQAAEAPTVAGVFSTGAARWALLEVPDGRILRVEPGARVSGATVVSVEANGVIVDANGQRVLIAVGAAIDLPN
jgi:hypothetical protein